MTAQIFSRHSYTKWKQYVIIFFICAYLGINLFRLGGDAFLISLNDNLAIPLAIAVTALSLALWKQIAVGNRNRLLWSGLTIGWALWTIAEFWWGIATILGQEVPYPSWADFFWLIGYIPMCIAMAVRIRALPNKIPTSQTIAFWGAILISFISTVNFVIIPIIKANDPEAHLESILNVLYPAVDLVLLALIFRILFSYQQGRYGLAWGWLSAGFVLHAFSNLYFSYATTADIYSPGGQVNLLNNMIADIPYNLGYLFWLIGLFIIQGIHKRHVAMEVAGSEKTLALVPNAHIVISTKGDDRVIDVSQNYSTLFPLNEVNGKTISEVLGLIPAEMEKLLIDIKSKKLLEEIPVTVTTNSGPQQAQVSGIAIQNPQGEYSGFELLVRLVSENYQVNDILTNYQKGIVNSLAIKTGTKQKENEEIKQLIVDYNLAYLRGFYNCIFAEGGSIMADAFLAELQMAAQQNGWQMVFLPSRLMDAKDLSLAQAREALPILVETAKRFVTKITDKSTADSIMKDVHGRFDEAIHASVSHFEKAKLM